MILLKKRSAQWPIF